jgi:hypothetical protein
MRVVAKAAVFSGGLTIVAHVIHGLPILCIPEQFLIASVRNDVVHHICGKRLA